MPYGVIQWAPVGVGIWSPRKVLDHPVFATWKPRMPAPELGPRKAFP